MLTVFAAAFEVTESTGRQIELSYTVRNGHNYASPHSPYCTQTPFITNEMTNEAAHTHGLGPRGAVDLLYSMTAFAKYEAEA